MPIVTNCFCRHDVSEMDLELTCFRAFYSKYLVKYWSRNPMRELAANNIWKRLADLSKKIIEN